MATAPQAAPAVEPAIGQAFNLVMTLKDPRRLPELMGRVKLVRDRLDEALGALNYVHFSRFVPLGEVGKLLIVTEFDGSQRDYVMDFAAVLDDEFSMILSYMKDGPRLPVSQYPEEFWDYVRRNTEILGPGQPVTRPFASYKDRTVLDVLEVLPPKDEPKATDQLLKKFPKQQPDLSSMQANIVRGYFSRDLSKPWFAAHLALRYDRAQGQALLKALTTYDAACRVTTMADWKGGKPAYCLNIGFTYDGLQALGVPKALLGAFPVAFREGPAKREAAVNPGGPPQAARAWTLGALRPQEQAQAEHALLSLYSEDRATFDAKLGALRSLLDQHSVQVVFELHPQDLGASRVHFGYRDSIANPRLAGLPGEAPADGGQRESLLGDFVLGRELVNSRGGKSLGDLPQGLAELASYAAVRIVQQDEAAFRRSLRQAAEALDKTTEEVAALLMGRDFDGRPLTAVTAEGEPGGPGRNDFLYKYPSKDHDDRAGVRCPFGAHIRRMNPRNGAVIGVPALRRVIRRGLPYGPKYEGESDTRERGLFGLFFCADLESQFEFMLKAWANGDVSSPRVRRSVDWLAAERRTPTIFRFGGKEIAIEPVTQTIGALYLLLPSMSALQRLADPPVKKPAPAPALKAPSGQAAPAPENPYAGSKTFSPLEPAFRIDPYRYYAELRREKPLLQVAKRQPTWWVLSYHAVADATKRDEQFVKPDKAHAMAAGAGVTARLGDGLFYMKKARHAQVRPALEQAFYEAYGGLDAAIQARAQRLLNAPERAGRLDVVRDYAAPLTTQVFMDMIGLAPSQWDTVDRWVRSALDGHHDGADPALRAAGGTSAMAMRAYFHALLLGDPQPERKVEGVPPPLVGETASGKCPLLHGIRALTQGLEGGCPQHAPAIEHPLSIDEAMQTALHFALGGYLSTEFLIGTGAYNLLRHPDQLALLRNGDVPWSQAVHEMLRYDAPFQMADRVAAADCQLGGEDIRAGDLVVLVYGSANHDGVYGDNAEAFDIRREPQQHFGFGPVARDCIGKAMGARVAEIALRVLFERWPKLGAGTRFQPGDWVADPYYRSLKSLQVLLDP